MKSRRPRHTTVPSTRPARRVHTPLPARRRESSPPKRPAPPRSPHRDAARIVDEASTSLVDVIDNLLNRGVVLNADVILALANVDLVYIRLSALLCAADRVLPHTASPRLRQGYVGQAKPGRAGQVKTS